MNRQKNRNPKLLTEIQEDSPKNLKEIEKAFPNFFPSQKMQTPVMVKKENEDIKHKINIAVIDFNISHTYYASIVFLPKEKYDLISEELSFYILPTAIPGFKKNGVRVMSHPLETIKEIIVI